KRPRYSAVCLAAMMSPLNSTAATMAPDVSVSRPLAHSVEGLRVQLVWSSRAEQYQPSCMPACVFPSIITKRCAVTMHAASVGAPVMVAADTAVFMLFVAMARADPRRGL